MFRPNNPFITTAQTRPHISVKLASNLQRELVIKVSACPVSLAATKGIMSLCSFLRKIKFAEMRKGRLFFSFPLGTEMFHFPRFPPLTLCIQVRVCRVHLQGFPHSDILGSKVACHLPGAYRRLPRPSSALHCQAIHRTPLRASAIQTLVTCPDEHRGLREPERNRNGCALIRCITYLRLHCKICC